MGWLPSKGAMAAVVVKLGEGGDGRASEAVVINGCLTWRSRASVQWSRAEHLSCILYVLPYCWYMNGYHQSVQQYLYRRLCAIIN